MQEKGAQIKYTDARATLTGSHKSPGSLSPSCPRARFSGGGLKTFWVPAKICQTVIDVCERSQKNIRKNNDNTTFQNVIRAYYTCIVARDCIPADLDSRYGIIVTMQSADYNTNITYTQTGHATEILPCDLTLDIVAHGFELIFVYNNLKCLVWIFGYLVV